MTITIAWDNTEKTIIRYDYKGHWTWNEYFAVMEQGVAMVKSVNHRVDLISNMKPGVMPMSGSALSLARSALRKLPTNTGLIVVVTNPFINALLIAFKSFDRDLGSSMRGAKTLKEAYEIIHREHEQILVTN